MLMPKHMQTFKFMISFLSFLFFFWVGGGSMLHMYLVSLKHTTSPSNLLLKGQEMQLKLELIGIEVEDSLILYPIHFLL